MKALMSGLEESIYAKPKAAARARGDRVSGFQAIHG